MHPQAEGFTEHARWDFATTRPDQYPLLLHFPYFDLYRKQVVKQADLVLAMHLRGDAFSDEEKARNFAYYEALTVRDSSLSAATQAVIAAEVGHLELAYAYLRECALIDLEDLALNTHEGLHMAALAGTWIATVAGFGGLRDHGGSITLAPRLPSALSRLVFRLCIRGSRLTVEVDHDPRPLHRRLRRPALALASRRAVPARAGVAGRARDPRGRRRAGARAARGAAAGAAPREGVARGRAYTDRSWKTTSAHRMPRSGAVSTRSRCASTGSAARRSRRTPQTRRSSTRSVRRRSRRCSSPIATSATRTVPDGSRGCSARVIGVTPVVLADSLSKRFGSVEAVSDLSFALEAGTITGFLGPNGAGKTTTLRMLLGLSVPTSGRALVFDTRYAELDRPAHRIGAVLEATDFHPGRSGRNHLRTLSQAAGIPDSRVDEVLKLVELDGAARRRVKGYSLGMRQRLGLASALLGDPDLLILDEPANGLDPEGVRWLRDFLRGYAKGGRTVLVSSHVLAEVAQTVDHVLIVAKGKLVIESPLAELTSRVGGTVRVRSPQVSRAAGGAAARGPRDVAGRRRRADRRRVRRSSASARSPRASSIVLHELASGGASLEEIFLELTSSGDDAPGAGGGGS